tara:strand:+ start:120 stop:1139 length:1020 start_codon:yes stop_codon:yes gene_type:complete
MFNLLSEKYDVTILHSGKSINNNKDKYKELIFPVKNYGPFYLQQGLIQEIQVNDYDYVILLFDVRWLNTIRTIFKYRKKVKVILWGAWLTNNNIINKIRLYLSKKVYANVFYTHKSRLDFINLGLDEIKTFVANNTFDVGERVKSFNNEVKDIILFVGSLDSRKENEVLISAFNNILDKIPESINLIFIGDGDEMINLTNQVNTFQIASRIKFVGRIEDSNELIGYYKRSIVSVSYGQSGLSVLQSLGYGVPFLTKENSISGGEKNNIKHKFNSIFCEDSIASLEYNLTELCLDMKYARELGKNAFEYYTKYCTIENMTQGFIDSIERTSKTTIDKTPS